MFGHIIEDLRFDETHQKIIESFLYYEDVIPSAEMDFPSDVGSRFVSQGTVFYAHRDYNITQEMVDGWVDFLAYALGGTFTAGPYEIGPRGQITRLGLDFFGFHPTHPYHGKALNGNEIFTQFITELTETVTAGKYTQDEKIRAIYDFIIFNFAYLGERDGAVLDGSMRPLPHTIPNWGNLGMCAEDILRFGEGMCNNFADLFAIMLRTIGVETRVIVGYYVNRDGSRISHTWAEVLLNGNAYYFDPQIEASWLKRDRANFITAPLNWCGQPIDSDLVAQRYVVQSTLIPSIPVALP